MDNGVEFYTRLATVTFGLWAVVTLCLGLTRCFRPAIASVTAPLFLLAIWLPHWFLARGFFRSMTGVWNPTTAEIIGAAFTWGLVATLLYVIFLVVLTPLGFLTPEARNRPWTVFRSVFVAHFIVAFAVGCVGGDRAFGILTVLDLQTYSLLIHARPGMGSGTFVSGSVVFFFPGVGGLTFAGYFVLVEALGNRLLGPCPKLST